MVRLPFVLAYPSGEQPAQTLFEHGLDWAVSRAVNRHSHLAPTWSVLPEQAIAACWAIGSIFDFPHPELLHTSAGSGWCETFGYFLMWHILAAPALREDARVAAALDTILVRLGRQAYEPGARVRLAEWIVAVRGLPKSASPTLVALDAEFARRDAVRSALRLQAGPALGAFMDAVLDDGGELRPGTRSDFAAKPQVVAMLGQTPEVLGDALVTLHRMGPASFGGYPDWHWLEKPSGAYAAEPLRGRWAKGVFHWLAGSILRRRIVVSDADMASLILGMADWEEYRSRHFLNQALKVARAAPGGLTAQALAKLPTQPNTPMPWDWRTDIAALAGCAAPVPALAPPKLDYWYHDTPALLSEHFANILDARLHDQPHQDLVAALAGLSEEDVYAAALVHFEVPKATTRAVEIRKYFFESCQGEESIAFKTRRLRDAAVVIAAQLRAAEPLITRHPGPAQSLRTVCAALESKSAPTQKWLAQANAAAGPIGPEGLLTMLRKLLDAEKSALPMHGSSKAYLRGLIYLSSGWDPAVTGPMLADLALRHCYQTVPGSGIRDERLGNACLWALSHMPGAVGVPWLARLLARVKYPKIRARIDAALNEAAAGAGMSRGELDELCVPGHGLDALGTLRLEVGGGAVTLTASERTVGLAWQSEAGKPAKAPTAAMKADKAGLQAAKALAKEIEADLATQADRLQRLYLEDRAWPADVWQQRYLGHPLLGILARRLVWQVDGPKGRTAALWADGTMRDADGRPVDLTGTDVRLWHPVDEAPEAILAWRERIATLQAVQPFAQAWREVYRVTDAELATATYSNRWAGHILKQHQFMSLARLNGWTVTHRTCFDARNDEPAHRVILAHGIVADYWVDGAGDPDEPEVLESGVYIYLTTDRLTFSRIAPGAAVKDSAYGPRRAAALPIAEVPPVVFSEVLRHCDLFTAVASIAGDPAWYDRGRDAAHPGGWHRDAMAYWERTSTADLSEAARTRRAMLEAVVPKLAIAGRCSFDDRALIVRGNLHSYRIHIGSAAVTVMPLMQHLCIVPASAERWEDGRIYLPFAGDRTLSVILSKAVLLAADDKITDPVILRQL